MNCEQLEGLYELYALGILEEPERAELRAHLQRSCPVCTPNYRRALALNAHLLATVPQHDPSPALRRRVLAGVGLAQPEAKKVWNWSRALRWSPLLAGLLFAAVWLNYREQQHQADLAAAREVNERTGAELRQARAVLDLLNEPETRQVTFGGAAPQPPRGRIFLHQRRGVVLIASNLAPLPAGRTYEMWLIPKGGAPRPAGLFQAGANQSAVHVQPGPVDADVAAVAVTVEPAAGSAAPTTQPLFAASVGL